MGNDAAKKWQERWGGFVHPHPVLNTKDGAAYYDATPGMTLRDWFAGQALISDPGNNPNLPDDPANTSRWPDAKDLAERRAKWAYHQADAMIAARKGGDA